jgi:hypothetical protein
MEFELRSLQRANPSVRGFPCGKRVRWFGWSRLTDLARTDLEIAPGRCQDSFERTETSLNRGLRGYRRYARIAASSARNAVNFSSACTTKRFPWSRCASTIQIVCPSGSTAETPTQAPTGLPEPVRDDFPVLHAHKRAMLGLDFAQTGSARNGSESGALNWGRSRKPSKTVNVRLMILLRKRRNQISGNFLFDAGRSLTDRSGPFAVRVCSVQAVRSLSVGPQ